MYGLPENFNGSFFIGRNLELVSFNENQVSFQFDEGVRVTTESSYIQQAPEQLARRDRYEVPALSDRVLSLFGSSVLSAVGTNDGTLTLVFDNGEKLIFLDTSNTYESYFIEHDGNSTIV